jgi:[glutamine synthetase] adenylyltransferase / [glutamine synthetase]-adenylyl-L-tyrosine phosphorylase
MDLNNAPPAARADPDIERAREFSRFARRLTDAEPDLGLEAGCGHSFDHPEMQALLAQTPTPDENALKGALRALRKRVMLRLMARDLAGHADLGEVVATTTALAQTAIAAALSWLDAHAATQYGHPRGERSSAVQHLHVVGMGKLGGCELNVSSDIDLILAYPEDGETDGARPISNQEYFTRLARRFVAALSEITADGHVFRVDLRLRPYGEGGPLVVSFEMLENYLITQGREWERYAWIKARTLTGDRAGDLMEFVRPFVYRRHLDFSAFASMRELHRQVRGEVERRDRLDDIKLGPGGIREIEFIVQVFQLIRGGRDPALRREPTLAVLPLLAERALLPAAAARELEEAYVFLRNLEHRLQYLDDQQTHMLPTAPADRLTIARSMGFADAERFLAELERLRAAVTRQFEAIFATTPREQHALAGLWNQPDEREHGIAQLATLGFRRGADLKQRLDAMRASARYRQMPATSQSRLDRIVPLAIAAAAERREPDATLARMLDLLDAVSRRESYLALLEQYPAALARVADLMSASAWVAQYLTQHPILLDELLDARIADAPPDWHALTAALRVQLDDVESDSEHQMNLLRHFKHVQTMRLIARDLAGTLPLETLSDHLSDLACIALAEVLRLAWQGLRQRHRAEPRFAVIGYGKLGGKELGYASDLDLVFLYDDGAEAAENYARLAQRIITSLTTPTAAGVLYETDLRLRPDGASGLLVSPFASFRDYQLRQAWMWEHQALTRARFAAGDAAIGREFERLRIEILRQGRDLEVLRREVVTMRQKMLDAHPNTSALFDIKHDRGGIIDVEFIVQYLVLGHASRHCELTGNIGNLALLKLAATLGLIDSDRALAAHAAYRRFRQLQHGLRLQGDRYARVPRTEVAASIGAVLELWDEVIARASNAIK